MWASASSAGNYNTPYLYIAVEYSTIQQLYIPTMATLRLPGAGGDAPKQGKFKVVKPPSFKDDAERQRYQKGSLALGARVMDEQGWGVGYGIGLSARDALDSNLIWVLPRGKPLRTIVSADLIGVNLAGEAVIPSKDGREGELSVLTMF